MRGLVVGLGSIGRRHARNWEALGVGPLAVCRRSRTEDGEYDEYDDLNTALESYKPDVVLVTNPTSLHVEAACKAVRAGAHVFMEKPIGDALGGVQELIEEASHRRRYLMVGYNLRFHPGLRRLRELVQSNAIGTVVSARAESGDYLPGWHPWEDYRSSYSGRRELGGGAVLTLSHELDALCWVLGSPRRLVAMATHASTLEIDTEDVAEIVMEFASGAVGSVHVDYMRRPPKRTLEVIGDEGVLRWEYDENRLLQYAPAARQWRIEEGDPAFERNAMYQAELRHFVSCVRGEAERPLIDGEQGAAVLALGLAALRSSTEGCAIDLQAEREPVVTWLNSLGRQA